MNGDNMTGSAAHASVGCACVRACVRGGAQQYSNRREFDLHVEVLELTQARLHWDKSSALTGILKRSELSVKRTRTHTRTAQRRNAQAHTPLLTPTHTHTHALREATGTCQNGEPCQIKREVCVLPR